MDFDELKEQHGDDAVEEAFMLGVVQGLKQAQEVDHVPVAYLLTDKRFCGNGLTKDKQIADYWAHVDPQSVHPLYLHALPCEACPHEENADQQRSMKSLARKQRNAITKRYKVLKAALETVKAVLESDDPAIADTVWVPGICAPETLLDHVCAALEAGKSANERLSNRTQLANDLERYNLWRRGAEDIEQPNTTKLGILIDEVVE